MFVVRWMTDVHIGQGEAFLSGIGQWFEHVGEKIGAPKSTVRVLKGMVGPNESRFEFEFEVESLVTLEKMWAEMDKIEAHAASVSSLGSVRISGTGKWEIYRPIEF